ncbi:MAG: hypothetical protein MRY83_12550 [Flavobacteriales bacterium]|nr:hypothetical protein [Flavobacteriales bacterium]
MLKRAILLISVLYCTVVSAQIDFEYQIRNDNRTGVRFGYRGRNDAIELGVAHLFIDKPCNRSTHRAFGPACSFPKRLELDATFEYKLNPGIHKQMIGQKLSLLYTLLAWQDGLDYGHKITYYTFGHTLWGLDVVHYTNLKESRVFPAFEIGLMSPHERLGVLSHSRIQLNARITYTYNQFLSDEESYFGLNRHNISLIFTVLQAQRHQ